MLKLGYLFLRRPTMDDVEAILSLKNNKKAALLLGGIHHMYSPEEIVNWINFHNNNPDEILLVIEDTVEGKLVGHVGLYKIDQITKETEFGILIADDGYRGKGYGTKLTSLMVEYAFKELGMHKVTAKVLSENLASVTMFKKCGFNIEGCLRDNIYKNGQYYDVLCLAVFNNSVDNN